MNHYKKDRRDFLSCIAKFFTIIICFGYLGVDVGAQKQVRSLRGIIYFSNNTPSNLSDFPVELFTANKKTRVGVTTPTEPGTFYLDDLKPGKYLLRITNPNRCVLTYRVDLRRQSITNVSVVMDAACAHHDGKVVDLPKR